MKIWYMPLVVVSLCAQAMEPSKVSQKRMILIVGPTRSGKSTLADHLRKRCNDYGIETDRISIDEVLKEFFIQEYENKSEVFNDSYKESNTKLDNIQQLVDRVHYPLARFMQKKIISAFSVDSVVHIIDYVSASPSGRAELARAIEPFRTKIVLVKLICDKEIARKRLELLNERNKRRIQELECAAVPSSASKQQIEHLKSQMRFPSSIDTYYTYDVCELPGISYDITCDTSNFSEAYEDLINQIMDHIV